MADKPMHRWGESPEELLRHAQACLGGIGGLLREASGAPLDVDPRDLACLIDTAVGQPLALAMERMGEGRPYKR